MYVPAAGTVCDGIMGKPTPTAMRATPWMVARPSQTGFNEKIRAGFDPRPILSRQTWQKQLLAVRRNLRLRDGLTVHHLVAVNLQTAQDLAEGQLGAQRLNLADLRGER